MSADDRVPDRFELVLVLVVYVVPLGAAVAFLVAVGLRGIALALLAVEALVSAAVVVAKRPADAERPGGPLGLGRLAGGLVLLGMVAGITSGFLLATGR